MYSTRGGWETHSERLWAGFRPEELSACVTRSFFLHKIWAAGEAKDRGEQPPCPGPGLQLVQLVGEQVLGDKYVLKIPPPKQLLFVDTGTACGAWLLDRLRLGGGR